jgi:pimeloyl-ACP methyl ester carboxylesterase
MKEHRTHRAVSDDGTEIVGKVSGHGPALVLVHGACADGESEWGAVVPLLHDTFTCYRPSTRCRGGSGTSHDLSPPRLVEDITAFIDSIGQPVLLAGVSGGGMLALGAAARSAAVTAVAVWEPPVFEVLPDDVAAAFAGVLEGMRERVAADDPVEAARVFLGFVGNDEEMAGLAASDALPAAGQFIPMDIQEIEHAATAAGPSPTDPSVLAKITVPALLLLGAETRLRTWFDSGARFAAEHLPDGRIRAVPGTGHLTHLVRPEPMARELRLFFASAPAPS